MRWKEEGEEYTIIFKRIGDEYISDDKYTEHKYCCSIIKDDDDEIRLKGTFTGNWGGEFEVTYEK